MTACVLFFTLSAERDPASVGEKAARKTSLAGGTRVDLEKAAQQQQIKLQEQMERILTSVKAMHDGGPARDNNRTAAGERNTSGGTVRKQQANTRSAKSELNRLAGPTMPGSKRKKTNFTLFAVLTKYLHSNFTDMNGEDLPEETSTGSGNDLIHKTAQSIIRKPGNYRKQFTISMCFYNVDGELTQSVTSVSGQNKGRVNGNKISVGSTTEKNEAMMENKVSTGSTEENQGSAGNKIPAGSVSRNNICTGSLVYNGVSAGHADGNKEHMAPADDRKDSTGSADLKKVKCQRQTRKVQQRQPAQGRYQQRTSNCKKETFHTDSSSSLTT